MKRKKGEGMIREYEPGKWLARITINGKQKSFYGSSEKEVAKKLKEFKNKISMGLNDFKKRSYADFLDMWLEHKKVTLKAQSYYRLESTVKIHIEPKIGFYDIDKIDAEIILSEVLKDKFKKFSYSSIKKIYDALNSSFKFAIKNRMILRNPMELVTIPTSTSMNHNKKDMEIFSEEEIKRFVTAANATFSNGIPVYLNGGMFLLMLNTGLRMGDA